MHILSRVTHVASYALLVALPLPGWANASARGWPVWVFGALHLPALCAKGSLLGPAPGDIHQPVALILLAVIALHVLGALYHALAVRDDALPRMLRDCPGIDDSRQAFRRTKLAMHRPVPKPHREAHFVTRVGWLRAAVLGANDGLLSTSSLMVGVAAAAAESSQIVLTGVAGIVAGAMSMAAGEYISVSSQADSEKADIARERLELLDDPEHEKRELIGIYVKRGLSEALATQVVEAVSAQDALEAHTRDELGITDTSTANPLQAAIASAASFLAGGLPPLATAVLAPAAMILWAIAIVAVASLAVLGAIGARAGGAPIAPGILRVVLWGSVAMAITATVGRLFHTALG